MRRDVWWSCSLVLLVLLIVPVAVSAETILTSGGSVLQGTIEFGIPAVISVESSTGDIFTVQRSNIKAIVFNEPKETAVETFDGNSTRTINASTPADSPLAALSDAFSNDQAASLTVNRFGNFTAYFKSLPPPVPAAYWASLFTVVVTALVGSLLIPAVVGWIKSKKQTSRLNSFHQHCI